MKDKLDVDVPPHTILGACNPKLAHAALEVEPDLGVLLPCNVVVRAAPEGGQIVGFMDPVAVMQMTDDPAVAVVATEVRARLDRVRSLLMAGAGQAQR